MFDLRKLPHASLAMFAIALAACGGGGSSSGPPGSGGSGGTTNNSAPLVVDAGPANNSADQAFTSVTICVPGTSACQTIDHVQVDTGSAGLRILSSLLTVALAQSPSIAECTQFADMTFLWGPLATADIKVAGEVAKSVPIQVINGQFQSIPQSCSGAGGTNINDAAGLGANGILGVGLFRQDCGSGCVVRAPLGHYYSCSAGSCQPASQALLAQVQNPVWMFSTDNNGVILQLPAVPDGGQLSATGTLTFGIGTQTNNGLGNASPLQVNPQTGNFSANFKGTAFNDSSFIDSGSNGYFFLDSATLSNTFGTSMPDCPNGGSSTGFYCPATTTPISVSVIGGSSGGTPVGASRSITFNIANANVLFNSNLSAFNDIGGANSSSFDFGLPFFFGKSVYTAIEGQSTPAGVGPYFAF